MSSIGTANSAVRRRALVHQGCMADAASTGDHGVPARERPGFGLPVETRQNAGSIVGMPACGTHPRRRCARRLCESRPAAWRGPGNGASCPSRAPQGSCAHGHPLNTRPWVVIRESRHDHPRQVPLMAEATITCVTCRTHQTPLVLTGMPGSRSRCPRRSTNGPCMKARGSPPGRWNLAGREPRQNKPRSAHQLPDGAIQAGSAGSHGEHGEINNWLTPPHIPDEWGLTVVRARWDVGCGTAGHPALQGRPELPTVRETT